MRNYFGTDGIRGVANELLTGELAFRCGNALSQMKEKPLVLIGRDTRISGDMLALSLSSGAISGGATVYDLGIIPTAGVAFLTKELNADFGVVISASHNTKEYNGIKIFSNEGYKLDEETEEEIEKKMNAFHFVENDDIGRYHQKFQLVDLYVSSITRTVPNGLKGFKVVIDCSNGASYKIAPTIYSRLGADVTSIGTSKKGVDINLNCGSLHPELLAEKVKENIGSVGFAYDGDSDRLVAVDENGKTVDGDKLIYLLACYLKEKGRLINDIAVGTTHTNMGVEKALLEKGIKLLRSDIGDKYVIQMMLKENGVVGGEQSGHIILKEFSTTGDGVLSSVIVAGILKETGKTLAELTDVKLYPQKNINIKVKDKVRVLNNAGLSAVLEEVRSYLGDKGRVVVRASGTEQLIRVFSETVTEELSTETAEKVAEYIRGLEI